jgi:hypothetical protein
MAELRQQLVRLSETTPLATARAGPGQIMPRVHATRQVRPPTPKRDNRMPASRPPVDAPDISTRGDSSGWTSPGRARRKKRKSISFVRHDERGPSIEFTDMQLTPRGRSVGRQGDGRDRQYTRTLQSPGLLFAPLDKQAGAEPCEVLWQEPKTPKPASALGKELFAAVDAADLPRVEQLVAAGADVNETDDEMGWSAVHHAVNLADEASRVQMIGALLQLGANADLEDLYHMTAVHMAAEEGCLESAKLLSYASRNRRGSVEFLASRHGFNDLADMLKDRWESGQAHTQAPQAPQATPPPSVPDLLAPAVAVAAEPFAPPLSDSAEMPPPQKVVLQGEPQPQHLMPVAQADQAGNDTGRRSTATKRFGCCGSRPRRAERRAPAPALAPALVAPAPAPALAPAPAGPTLPPGWSTAYSRSDGAQVRLAASRVVGSLGGVQACT